MLSESLSRHGDDCTDLAFLDVVSWKGTGRSEVAEVHSSDNCTNDCNQQDDQYYSA